MKNWGKHWIVVINLEPLDWQSSIGNTNLWQLQETVGFPNVHCLGPSILVKRLFLAFLFIKINPLSLKDLLLVFSKSRALRAPFLTKMLNLFFSIAPGKCHKNIWIKVFKNGPRKIFGRKPLKNLLRLRRPYQFEFFKCSLPQILLHPFSNILTNLFAKKKKKKSGHREKTVQIMLRLLSSNVYLYFKRSTLLF